MRVLFLTWDGPQQSYLQSLFFPIFAGLQRRGVDVHTLQLSWGSAEQRFRPRSAAAKMGLSCSTLAIPARLRAVALPGCIAIGAAAAARYMRRHDVQTLLPRSLIPMAMALGVRRLLPALDLAFEADGFMADERVDFGGWSKQGLPYRALRHVERRGTELARAVICRTEDARGILAERARLSTQAEAKIFVAPNAKDSDEFKPASERDRLLTRARYGIDPGVPWLVYVGSIGPQYRADLMLQAFSEILKRRPDARLSCFTMHSAALERLLLQHQLPRGVVSIASAPPNEIPAILGSADLGFALRRECFSQRGVCPIKVAEYLLCGLPVVTSPVGDLAAQLGSNPAALLVDANVQGASAVSRWFLNSVLPDLDRRREHARQLGLQWFELGKSIDVYFRMLQYRAAEAGA